jgi:hypothetical protein
VVAMDTAVALVVATVVCLNFELFTKAKSNL